MASKRKCLSVEEKIKVLKHAEKKPGLSQAAIACHFGMAQPTVSLIFKKRDSIVALAAKGTLGVKRNRQTNCDLLERGLESFYDACQAKKLKSMTYDVLITKGREIAKELITKDLVQESNLPSTDAAW